MIKSLTIGQEKHWAAQNFPAHKDIRRYNYESWISSRLGGQALPESSVRGRLRDIKHTLTFDGCPSKIVEKKDAQWTIDCKIAWVICSRLAKSANRLGVSIFYRSFSKLQ